MPIPDLYVLQAGTNASTDTFGLSRAPTVKLMGITDVQFTPLVESELFDEIRGSLAPGFESEVARVSGEASIDGIATYEDIPYYLNAAMGSPTATNWAGDTDYWNRDYDAPLRVYDSDVSALAPTLYTFVYGDAVTAVTSSDTEGFRGAVLTSLSISAEEGSPTTFSTTWMGRNVENDSLADLADRDVNAIMGDHWSLFIDPSGTAPGTTAIANTGFAWDLNINTNRALVRHLGSLYPDNYRDAKWTGSLSLMLELTSTTRGWLDSDILGAAAPFRRNVRLKATGQADTDQHDLELDFAGVTLASPTVITDRDGVVTVEFELTGMYDSTMANWLRGVSRTNVQTLA